jgi:prephenate dehydratase
LRVAFLGPVGTFSEEALFTQPDYRAATVVPFGSLAEVLGAVHTGAVDIGFVPLENAIEGTVNATLDMLVFDVDLLIQREVVFDVHLHLLGYPGTALTSVRRLLSFPVATAQCRAFLAEHLPGVEIVPTNSTADSAQILGEHPDPHTAALAPLLAAEIYGLVELVDTPVEDHRDNQTRFVAVARDRIPSPTGHDKTTIVCFQRDDRPGNLHGILGEFAARGINLTKLESRPTKRGLGDYCFIIELEGHVADEIIGDCLAHLHAELARVKLLGSYPAAGPAGPARRAEVGEAKRAADQWLTSVRDLVERPIR